MYSKIGRQINRRKRQYVIINPLLNVLKAKLVSYPETSSYPEKRRFNCRLELKYDIIITSLAYKNYVMLLNYKILKWNIYLFSPVVVLNV